ncbi:hypothetical protein O1611_g4217 [Lasiodiplodia mahajangana]|uniref:Uncharacterized protein n=1 Tax=Lasiodiplodia mahajangana TaxID=1108764 RepID=A0ACC2JQE5_9PEZI|nr:hypothetical protein O1611_g4217 [Lasiodiplodia mahajangana]
MSFISWAWSRLGHRAPLRPRIFANPNFIRIPPNDKVEEETLPDYLPARYYPVRIGQVFVDRYQVVGKLGFGASSTVWLARDLGQRCHVALKVFIRSQALGDRVENEIAMYKRMEQRAPSHPARAFADRAASRWNETDEMDYLNKLYGKWMPPATPRVAVDGRPRLSGIMDTINSTLAHGPDTRLPKEFYDPKGRKIIEKIAVDEWLSGFKESEEYRTLGVGGLMGDVVGRMVGSAEHSSADGEYEVGRPQNKKRPDGDKNTTPIRFGLSGCHDTTLGGVLASLGAFEGDEWPPFTSHIAIEMFHKKNAASELHSDAPTTSQATSDPSSGFSSSWFASWTSLFWGRAAPGAPPPGIGRKGTTELEPHEKAKLQEYYVRLRYNDEVVTIPGCRAPGKHLEGDESFCTLEAFKAIVDKFVPRNWKQECSANVKGPAFPTKPEPAGY